MKFSEQWLREWVNPDISTAQLAEQLTMAGLEVDAIDPVAGEFDNVVVGEVLSVEPHPDADKLRVCLVNIGAKDPVSIVCGASNVCVGLRVPTAQIGAQLPGGLKIKKSKLRGVTSSGMLCSEKELGLAEQAAGLMELPSDAPVGQDIREYLQLDDVSIELDLTPNRGDCLGMAGVAREVAVLNRLAVTPPAQQDVSVKIKDVLDVKLHAPTDCPHYAGRIIRNINAQAKTPLWMQERLRRSGLRGLGPVVDVTNYVLLELGQPMHAFDLAKLSGNIQVRHAQAGEKLQLLDGQELELSEGTLLIADDKQPVALAGIMGGVDSAVQAATTDIFLESAYFAPLAIAGRARAYGLHTDSSHRFERGVSPELQLQALDRATELLLNIVGGQAGPVTDVTVAEHLPVRASVTLRASRIARVLGTEIPKKEVTDILTRLGLEVSEQEECWQVVPPGFRFDISIEEDLIEEVGRIYGYENLRHGNSAPSRVPCSQSPINMAARPEAEVNLRQMRDTLVAQGYQEVVTYSFVDPKLQKLLDPEGAPVALANPIASDLSVMRTSLWPGLVQTMMYNLNRQQDRICLFEYGLRFIEQDTDIKQEMMLSGVITGTAVPEQWGIQGRKVDYFDAKQPVEALLALTGQPDEFRFQADTHPALHPGQTASIWRNKQCVGWLGALHPKVEQALDLSQQAFVFELAVAAIQGRTLPSFRPLSKYPAIRRDISILVDQSVTAQQVRDCIKSASPETLQKVQLFDVYMGEGVDSGRKSLSLGLTLQDLSRTLNEREVEVAVDTILGALSTDLGATLRE